MVRWSHYLLVIIILLNLTLCGQDKTLIITHSFNRSDFIEIQEKTFKKFMKSPYEFVVFNDAKNSKSENEIQSICDRLNIECIRIPQEIHKAPGDAAICCADVVKYSLDNLGFDYDGYVMIIDADMFLMQPFDVNEYMRDVFVAGHPQRRGDVDYIWNGIVILDMKRLPCKRDFDFNCGVVEGHLCDVGGYTYYYFKDHPEVQVKAMTPHYWLENYRNHDRKTFPPMFQFVMKRKVYNCEFFINSTFFHYRSGGNWDGRPEGYHKRKTRLLHELIDFALNQEV